MLVVFLALFVVSFVSVACAVLVCRSHSLFRLSLFPESVFSVSFAGCVLSLVPDLSFVTLVCVGSLSVVFAASVWLYFHFQSVFIVC